MYNRYNFDIDPKDLYVVGDIHGEWNFLRYKITESGISNSVIIIAGDCGFGFEKKLHYDGVYRTFSKQLEKNNVTLIFVRGNHDDPSYYDGIIVNETYFKAIPDYSVITLRNNYNILCVGGGVSIDRVSRIERDEMNKRLRRNKTKCYWENEMPFYSKDILNKILSDRININTVITHTTPDFAPLTDKNGIQYFFLQDKNLESDIIKERFIMTQIYNHLINDGHKIKKWIYGHFHQHNVYYHNNGIKFIMLDCVCGRKNYWDVIACEK